MIQLPDFMEYRFRTKSIEKKRRNKTLGISYIFKKGISQ